MGLHCIGAGAPRTGTASLKTAFETLGFGECQHMESLFNRPHLVDHWVELFKTGKTDYQKLFEGFQSTSDFPGYLLYRNLLDQYPDAKVILTVRDPEDWYESAIRTVHAYTPQTFQQKLKMLPKRIKSKRFRGIAKTLRLVEVFLWKGYFEGRFHDKDFAIDKYLAFMEQVRNDVPSDQLLEYKISDGWEPLAHFLGVEVPDVPFPHRNQRDQFIAQLTKMMQGGGPLKIK